MTKVLDSFADLGSVVRDVATSVVRGDYAPALRDVIPVLERQHSGMFAGSTEADGTPWAPLALSTIKRKGHSQILIDTEQLLNALAEDGMRYSIREIDPEGLTFGTDHPAAGFHDTGTSRMPARPPVGISDDSLDQAEDIIADWAQRLALEELSQ